MMDHTGVVSTQTLSLQSDDSLSVNDRDQWTCKAVHAPGELVGEWAGTVKWVKGHGEGEVDCTATASVTTAAVDPSSGPHGWNGHGFTGSSRESGGIQLSFEGECAAMPSANLLVNRSLFMQYSPQELPCTVCASRPLLSPRNDTPRSVQPRLLRFGLVSEWGSLTVGPSDHTARAGRAKRGQRTGGGRRP
jgi:hypothetical protein